MNALFGLQAAMAGLVLALGTAGQALATEGTEATESCKGGWPGEVGVPVVVAVEGHAQDAEWRAVVKIARSEIRSLTKLEIVADVFDLVLDLNEAAAQRLRAMRASARGAGITDAALILDVCDEPFSVAYRPLLAPGETTLRVVGEGSTWGVTAARADQLISGVGF
ncbi:MAG: hypothetical protein AAF918_15480 [Pseudomonadota bacterium]